MWQQNGICIFHLKKKKKLILIYCSISVFTIISQQRVGAELQSGRKRPWFVVVVA